MSHRQHKAGCPPTVQRGSGSSPRWRQKSSVSGVASSRSPISPSPTGSCLVCWSAMERRRPAPRSERRCLGSRRQRLLDTRSVGREFVLAYPAAARSPTRRPRATRDGPPEERGPIRRAAQREAVPWVHWESRGPSRPLARRGYPNDFRANQHRPDGPRSYRDAHTSSVATCCFLDGREPAHGRDG
jgi:hypothetical protein